MSSTHNPETILLKGVRQNNLKNFDIHIPIGQLTVVTGLSGAGKSSFVFETLHAAGQRSYIETFSSYTRQFLETMPAPQIDAAENIRPSIAIEQTNTVKTSRSTVGTMTELCDYFKVWFPNVAQLFDPISGELVEDDTPPSIWNKTLLKFPNTSLLIAFKIQKPNNLSWPEIISPLISQGYLRCILDNSILRLEELDPNSLSSNSITIIQDRVTVNPSEQNRFLESLKTALHLGKGQIYLYSINADFLASFSQGLHSPSTGQTFEPASPNLFSFNSPIGACPKCKGFGRMIEIDYNLVIPDHSLSLKQGAIRAFHGDTFSECLKDLLKHATRLKIRTDIPWKDLSQEEKNLVIQGEPDYVNDEKSWPSAWYGIQGFFDWLESKSYKPHMRFLLSKYRTYVQCSECNGKRLRSSALNWRWQNYTLPELYQLPIKDLYHLLKSHTHPQENSNHAVDLALQSILTRLNYLLRVGLGYLTLDRTSRTLSGGEVERVNLTTCLGTSLVETLFVLDEPSVGLHPRDIDRLIETLKFLTSSGNTVVVVEHDEAIMRAADNIIEIGPLPGKNGGHVTFHGNYTSILEDHQSITGAYLSNRKNIPVPQSRRPIKNLPKLSFSKASKNNIKDLSFSLPLKSLTALCGVSGSGKSTLLNSIIYEGLLAHQGKAVEDPATIESISCPIPLSEVVLIDQSPINKTPRSNPVLFVDAWDDIRQLFATTPQSKSQELTAAYFSFNTGHGRCDHCAGLGYEQVEMQFLSDVFIPCPICDGKRFKPEILEIKWNDLSIHDVLQLEISQALDTFKSLPRLRSKLQSLADVGLGYLSLGQPLNTLSGGESQRLKLVKYLSQIQSDQDHAILLLDEPTTGLHRDDVNRLLSVLQKLVDKGHSIIVIEHHLDVLKSADWLLEMGPEAGSDGGKIIAAGTPEDISKLKTPTAPFLDAALRGTKLETILQSPQQLKQKPAPTSKPQVLSLIGAREHNLKNVSLTIPHKQITVLSGVSGSGKSTLAFDIIFAEGQRRFIESISSYARQFIEQLPKPHIDQLTGIAPTVAIEQRVTHGTRKSTVATITEVAQFLRLLYAKIGIQFSPTSNRILTNLSTETITEKIHHCCQEFSKKKQLLLLSPVVKNKKGHHQPIVTWLKQQGYSSIRADKILTPIDSFEKLDRYREHDLDAVIADLQTPLSEKDFASLVQKALKLGNGSCILADEKGKNLAFFSSLKADPVTGEAFPELDPKDFSWNSPKGWCPSCRGFGRIYPWMNDHPKAHKADEDGLLCPDCLGSRLNPISRAVKIKLKDDRYLNLPDLLQSNSPQLLSTLKSLDLTHRDALIAKEIIQQIQQRLKFMEQVGLDYLSLDRSTDSLSGGEAQRIRLASQLSSNLSGTLYVLDEPSIGLHSRDNERLIQSLLSLKNKGNTLLIVEHDEDTMRIADHIIDLGPGAGKHGGQILAQGSIQDLAKNPLSITGQCLLHPLHHPLRKERRPLPKRTPDSANLWLELHQAQLRNLKGDDLFIPLSKLTVVCGVSGTGKSTLIRDLLKPSVEYAIEHKLHSLLGDEFLKKKIINLESNDKKLKAPLKELINANHFKKVIEVDQSPIGKTLRSTPATYIGAFDHIRNFFASVPEAKIRGYTPSMFSFNTKSGSCPSCKGSGQTKLEMNFLPDTYITCESCHGSRYSPDINQIEWNGKTISNVLNMSFEEASQFFSFHSNLKAMMDFMVDTGLGYLTLGQPSPTLSGGESQRIKLVGELISGLPSLKERRRGDLPKNLYILEEPTIGLHMHDCERLIHLLHKLVDQNHTVIVIEHNLDIIAEADYLVEVGPEGGDKGGHILFQGPPELLLKLKSSPTAPFLRTKLLHS